MEGVKTIAVLMAAMVAIAVVSIIGSVIENSNKQKFQIDCVKAGGTVKDNVCVRVTSR